MDIRSLSSGRGLTVTSPITSPSGGLSFQSPQDRDIFNQIQWPTTQRTAANYPEQVQGTYTNSTGTGSGGGGAAAPSADTVKQDAINSVYDQRISRLKNVEGGLGDRQQSAIDSYMGGFNHNASLLEDARNRGRRNVDLSKQQNDQNKTKSFRDISSSIRNSIDAFRNQLGTMNASDSSAADVMAPYAFAKLNTQQRGDVLDTYNTNATNLNIAQQDIEADYANQLNSLKLEKDNAVRGIVDQFKQIRQQIQDEIATSDEARAFELANLGQQYTMKALADIQSLDDNYNATADRLVQDYTKRMPAVDQAALNPQVAQDVYSSYGRSYVPQINRFSDPGEANTIAVAQRDKERLF